MKSTDILIVDDEVGIRDLLSEILQDEGYGVATAENATVARKMREQTRPAMVLLDIWMPDCDGITLLKEWSQNGLLDMPVVVMSGHGSIDTAVEATKIGALNYLEKPISLQNLLETVRQAMKESSKHISSHLSLLDLGKSNTIQEMIDHVTEIAKTDHNILLSGETGSPFEIVARHFCQDFNHWIDSSKLENWLESAVTGVAIKNGTVIYLQDISQYDKVMQKKLLRSMRKKKQFNMRFIGYVCKPLTQIYNQSEFDLCFIEELSHALVVIPPLREQLSDLFFLINKVLAKMVENKQVKMVHFTPQALQVLTEYDWPGNIDQLHHVVKNLALHTQEGLIEADDVVGMLKQFKTEYRNEAGYFDFDQPIRELRDAVEKSYFEYHIKQENFNLSRVARRVGMERTHLYRKMQQLGINVSPKKKK